MSFNVAELKSHLSVENLKNNKWLAFAAIILAYKLHFIFYFHFLPTGFHLSLLEKFKISNFKFQSIYESSSFILSASKFLYFSVPVLLSTIFLFFFSKKNSWNAIANDSLAKPTKFFILFIVLFTVWYYAFSGYNFYWDKPFYFDRIIIIIIGVLLFRYTWLMPVFIGAVMLWLAQINFPMDAGSITDRKIVYEILFLFTGYLVAKAFFEIKQYILWILLLSLIATNYFFPLIAKINISPTWYQWIVENELWTLLQKSVANNWLGFLSESQKNSLLETTQNLNFVLLLFTFVLELFSIFILFNRKLTITLLILFSIFHIGIFAAAGVFFWKWILFDWCLVFLLIVYKDNFSTLFTKQNFIISIAIIIFSPWLFSPVMLGWWDDRCSTIMKYEVVDYDNNTFIIAGNQIHPYEQAFTFQRFFYLIPDSIPHVINMPTNYDLFHSLRVLKRDELNFWIEKNRVKTYDEEKVKKFDNFIVTYFENYNKRITKKDFFDSKIAAPEHIWTSKYPKNQFPNDRPVKAFKVKFYQCYQNEKQFFVVSENYVYERNFETVQ